MVLWTNCQKRLISLLGSDAAIHDPARIMRLPGFLNHKEPVAMSSIIDGDPARIYDLRCLRPLLRALLSESESTTLQTQNDFAIQSRTPVGSGMGDIRTARLVAARWSGAAKGGRNARAFQNAAYLVRNLGLTEAQAWSILQQWNRGNRPPLSQWELRQTLRNARIYGRHRTDN
jgi:hypothetical protein